MNNYILRVIPRRDLKLKAIVKEAVLDPELGPIVDRRLKISALCILEGGEILGFAIPRKDTDGRMRSGPIFIRPEYRRMGLATRLLNHIFKGVKARAMISENNIASQRTYEKLGFIKTGKAVMPDGTERYDEWVREAVSPASEGWLNDLNKKDPDEFNREYFNTWTTQKPKNDG